VDTAAVPKVLTFWLEACGEVVPPVVELRWRS